MGAVCVDAAPVRFMGMAEHAASAEMLTASRYDKLDVLGLRSPAQAVHSSWQVRVAIASCRGDRKSVMHRTASASRSWKLIAPMRSAGARRAGARSWRCLQGKVSERKPLARTRIWNPHHPIADAFQNYQLSRPLDCTPLLATLSATPRCRSGWHRRQPPRKPRSVRRSRSS